MLVFADCDFERTVAGALTSMRFTRQGQSCTAASRIYVERPIFQRFVDAMAEKVDAMVMGDPLDERDGHRHHHQPRSVRPRAAATSTQGSETAGATRPRLLRHAVRPGAEARGCSSSRTSSPTCRTTARWCRRKSSAPSPASSPFDDVEDVLARANGTEYGLAASVWTNNLTVGLDLAHRLEAGLVATEPEPGRSGQSLLRRREEQRARQGSQPRGYAGAFHAQEDNHG